MINKNSNFIKVAILHPPINCGSLPYHQAWIIMKKKARGRQLKYKSPSKDDPAGFLDHQRTVLSIEHLQVW